MCLNNISNFLGVTQLSKLPHTFSITVEWADHNRPFGGVSVINNLIILILHVNSHKEFQFLKIDRKLK